MRRQADDFSFTARDVLQFIIEEKRLPKRHSADSSTNWSCRRNTVCHFFRGLNFSACFSFSYY
jgi:hypothetical protein